MSIAIPIVGWSDSKSQMALPDTKENAAGDPGRRLPIKHLMVDSRLVAHLMQRDKSGIFKHA